MALIALAVQLNLPPPLPLSPSIPPLTQHPFPETPFQMIMFERITSKSDVDDRIKYPLVIRRRANKRWTKCHQFRITVD